MKKALQIPHLRAEVSVSDGAGGRGPGESHFYGFRNIFPQLRVLDPRGDGCRFAGLLRSRLEKRGRSRLRTCIRQRAGHEAKPRAAGQTARDLACTLGELEAPDGVADMDDERPVGLRPCRPGITRDLLAHGRGPSGHDVTGAAVGPDAAQLRANFLAEPFHQAADSSTAPGVTSSNWSGTAGSSDGSVAVTSAWPTLPTRAARIRRRSGSSSERTSSSRSSGGTPVRSAIVSASASSNASRASRCAPWEPKLRRSR